MPQYGESFLSKVLDEGNVRPIKQYNVTEGDLEQGTERDAYKYIIEYANENRGATPDYRTVVEQFPDFYYREGVTDTFRWLTRQIKSESAKRQIIELTQSSETGRRLEEDNGADFAEYLRSKIADIELDTNTNEQVGTNLKRDHDKFMQEYRARKAGESFKTWLSKFPTINEEIGGYFGGNNYAWIGRSGRGKSIFAMEEGLEAAFQGANVLVWAMEMSWFEWMARAYASISARQGMLSATIDGVDYEVGFENRALLQGSLSGEFEEGFEDFLASLNEVIPGNITVRAVDDEDFTRRDVRQLESDIIQTDADVVIIDPIYYMDYETNTSKTAGGDVANTSKALRALAGRTKVVMHVITQAEEIKEEEDEDGYRELQPAKRQETKKAKQILEDASNLFGIDSVDGRGAIRLGKGRSGGEGAIVEVTYLPNHGVVRELDMKDQLLQGAF